MRIVTTASRLGNIAVAASAASLALMGAAAPAMAATSTAKPAITAGACTSSNETSVHLTYHLPKDPGHSVTVCINGSGPSTHVPSNAIYTRLCAGNNRGSITHVNSNGTYSTRTFSPGDTYVLDMTLRAVTVTGSAGDDKC